MLLNDVVGDKGERVDGTPDVDVVVDVNGGSAEGLLSPLVHATASWTLKRMQFNGKSFKVAG